MAKWEIVKIDGMCVTKESLHYHTAVKDNTAKEWYLNTKWAVSVGQCHEKRLTVIRGNPYVDWNNCE